MANLLEKMFPQGINGPQRKHGGWRSLLFWQEIIDRLDKHRIDERTWKRKERELNERIKVTCHIPNKKHTKCVKVHVQYYCVSFHPPKLSLMTTCLFGCFKDLETRLDLYRSKGLLGSTSSDSQMNDRLSQYQQEVQEQKKLIRVSDSHLQWHFVLLGVKKIVKLFSLCSVHPWIHAIWFYWCFFFNCHQQSGYSLLK